MLVGASNESSASRTGSTQRHTLVRDNQQVHSRSPDDGVGDRRASEAEIKGEHVP